MNLPHRDSTDVTLALNHHAVLVQVHMGSRGSLLAATVVHLDPYEATVRDIGQVLSEGVGDDLKLGVAALVGGPYCHSLKSWEDHLRKCSSTEVVAVTLSFDSCCHWFLGGVFQHVFQKILWICSVVHLVGLNLAVILARQGYIRDAVGHGHYIESYQIWRQS